MDLKLAFLNLVTFILIAAVARKLYCILVQARKDNPPNISYSEHELRNYLTEVELLYENKIRLRWLVAFYIVSFFFLISKIAFFDALGIVGMYGIAAIGGIITLISIPSFWLSYRWCYKKRGTKWLMFILIIAPISIVAELFKDRNIILQDEVFAFCVILYLAFQCYYLVTCYKLRKVNLKRKKAMTQLAFESEGERIDCANQMKNAESLDSLDEVYNYAAKTWPKWSKHFKQIYAAKKLLLAQNCHV